MFRPVSDRPRTNDGLFPSYEQSTVSRENLTTAISQIFEALYDELNNLSDAWSGTAVTPGISKIQRNFIKNSRLAAYRLSDRVDHTDHHLIQLLSSGVEGLISSLSGIRDTVVADPQGAPTETTVLAFWPFEEQQWGDEGPLPSSLNVDTYTNSTTLDLANKVVLCDATSNTITITLPLASLRTGAEYYIKKIDSSANEVSVSRSGSDTIDGDATRDLSFEWDAIHIVSDGSDWFIV